MNRTVFITTPLNSETNDTIEHPVPIPDGITWKILEFTCTDFNMGDNISSAYVLRFGTDILEIVAVTGATHPMKLSSDIIGDGIKKLNVIRYNNSGYTKQCPFKIKIFERTQ